MNNPVDDARAMRRAIDLAWHARCSSSPNPWVGAVLRTPDGEEYEGWTAPPGGPHAEATALSRAGSRARGSTLYTTLEPCAHQGRTPPCTEAIIEAGVSRVVVGVLDPDPLVSGRGVERLSGAGIEVEVGMLGDQVSEQLAPYLKQRRTGLPWVVLKMAASLDGRSAARDGSSKWLTGSLARQDAHRLRAEADAILVGAGTVRADDPSLTVRLPGGPWRQPLRVVLGHIPPRAKVNPAIELSGDLFSVLSKLGSMGVVTLLVEGGAKVAHEFHTARLVDHYVVYLAPAIFADNFARPLFDGSGAAKMDELWRGRIVAVKRLGEDVRLDVDPVRGEDATRKAV
ncbi:MAG: bifunctional diaminohydroxyphosphoribosylaminopyrimidine deaminase/5-amino-6-(5-phosphoribosylamino)uracil reductase RibD [Actinobacteria bacterium]|nr:bifunctional diaminohydroxyphosphoribosylaminopyrimidine deaminase/5-amino-6-(5-phosphoribosylamino)uracil reductase RibD [Actinomycetota bacterium]